MRDSVRISEFGVATAHSNELAFCVGINISITIHYTEMDFFIPTQNGSFECAVEILNSLIRYLVYPGLGLDLKEWS